MAQRIPQSTDRVASLQNPAPREEQILLPAYQDFSLSKITGSPQTRLPPRSRRGCWTCRVRKVKCDEGRPRCNQCTRLNHVCDYSPKLAFKDETPGIIDKYLGSTSPPDDRDSMTDFSASRRNSTLSDDDDDCSTFKSPANEEELERKAETQPPGTYFVVVNSDELAKFEDSRAPLQPPSVRKSGPYANRLGEWLATELLPDEGTRHVSTDISEELYTTILEVLPAWRRARSEDSAAAKSIAAQLYLWGQDYSDGRLNMILSRAEDLRDTTIDLLQQIGRLLLNGKPTGLSLLFPYN